LVQQVNQQEVGLSESDVHMFELIRYKEKKNLFAIYKCQSKILVLDLKLVPLVPAGRMQVQASNLPKQNTVQTFLI
jgi:hypothetical protein